MSLNNCEGLGWLQPCFTWHKIAFLCLKQHCHWTESHDWEKGINKCLQFIFASMRQLDECYHSPVTSDNISACSRIQENDEEGDFKRVWQRVIALSHSLLLSIRITPLIWKSAASFYIIHVGEKKSTDPLFHMFSFLEMRILWKIAHWVRDQQTTKNLSFFPVRYQPLRNVHIWEEVTAPEPLGVRLWWPGFVPVTAWHLPAGSERTEEIKCDCVAFGTSQESRNKCTEMGIFGNVG